MRLSHALTSLVEADPVLACYAVRFLGRGVPYNPNDFYFSNLQSVRQEILKGLLHPKKPKPGPSQLSADDLDQLEEQWVGQLLEQESLRRLLVWGVDPDDLPDVSRQLRSPRPAVRILTAQAVGRHRLPLEKELIALLEDPSPAVVQSAHASLVRLARGTDFGPPRGAYRSTRRRAAEKWRSWLALQREDDARARSDRGSTPAPGLDQALALRAVLRTDADPAAALCEELLQASTEHRDAVLERLKRAHGIEHTEALTLAIHRLSGSDRTSVRRALAERLTRMTGATLRAKLGDEDAEVRRAAALACALKDDKRHVPDLIPLLEDRAPSVCRGAHLALRSLTGQDFGPTADAGLEDVARARAAWQEWWQNQRDR